jgi:RNA polymerase sigma-70 factor, ECF subfamily
MGHEEVMESPRSIEALYDLFDRALPEVYGYFMHRCRDRAMAEDLTSETFLAAIDSFERQTLDPSIPWLIGIGRHKLVDHWRRTSREERQLASVALEARVDEWHDEFEAGRAWDVLGGLNSSQRLALTLRYVDGLSVPDVAELVGRSVHATETLLMRAKAAFRRSYGANGVDDDV